MHLLLRHAQRVLVILSFTALAACASFPGEKLKGAAIPDVSSRPYQPSAYIDVRFFQGNPGDPRAVEIPAGKPVAQGAVERVLKQGSPFSRYSFDAFDQDKMDHVVKLHYYNYGEAGGAVILGMITGFTFGVIPSAATDRYALMASADTKASAPPAPLRSDDSVTTWLGLWFIPLSSKTPQKAVDSTLEDLTRDGLRQVIAANQLRFAAPEAAAAPTSPAAAPETSPQAPAPSAPSRP